MKVYNAVYKFYAYQPYFLVNTGTLKKANNSTN